MALQKSNALGTNLQHHTLPSFSPAKTREIPILAVAGSMCWVCNIQRDDSHTLKTCSGCWKATYCSAKCQVQHWAAEHKAQCKIFRLVGEETKQKQGIKWDEYSKLQIVRSKSAIKKSEKLNIDFHNIHLAIYQQPFCDTCHLTTLDFSGDKRITLSPCAECQMAFWCSQNCRNLSYLKHQQEICKELSEQVAYHCMRYSGCILDLGALRLANSSVSLPTEHPRSTHVQLSSLVSWRDYFDLSKLPTAGCMSTTNKVTSFDSKTVTRYMDLKNTSNEMTCVLTILAGLEATITDLDTKSALTIHLVGAAQWEVGKRMLIEELFHLCSGLKHLTVGYVGPENGFFNFINGVNRPASTRLESLDSCKECQSKGRSNRMFCYRGLYHEFLATDLATHHPPDLIVAFTSGHQDTDIDTWAPTLKQILASNKPAVFTTFNAKEASEEEAAFDKLGTSFIMRPQINTWHGLVGYYERSGPKYTLWYKNLYWYIVKGHDPASMSSA